MNITRYCIETSLTSYELHYNSYVLVKAPCSHYCECSYRSLYRILSLTYTCVSRFVTAYTDECSPQPCQNGGTCVDAIGAFSCTCVAGYTGATCQTSNSITCVVKCINVNKTECFIFSFYIF